MGKVCTRLGGKFGGRQEGLEAEGWNVRQGGQRVGVCIQGAGVCKDVPGREGHRAQGSQEC